MKKQQNSVLYTSNLSTNKKSGVLIKTNYYSIDILLIKYGIDGTTAGLLHFDRIYYFFFVTKSITIYLSLLAALSREHNKTNFCRAETDHKY